MKKALSVALSVFLALYVLTFAIAIPITFRAFYYAQIEPLEIEEYSGFSREVIVDAFDSVMDYLHGKGEFSVGELSYTAEGQAHFEDCKVLFDLDYIVLAISAVASAAIIIASSKIKLHKFFGFPPYFYSAIGILGFFSIVAVIGVIDFNFLFTLFHTVCFPGKSNWIFGWYTDEIIRILPQQFFANCAILIFGIIFIVSALFIIFGIRERRKNENR